MRIFLKKSPAWARCRLTSFYLSRNAVKAGTPQESFLDAGPREGQIALQKLGRPDAHNSRRIDIPKDDVDPYNRLEEGKKYFDLARPEYQDLTPIFKLVKEVLPQK